MPSLPRCRPFLKAALRWGEHVLAVVGALTILYACCFRLSPLATSSMSPTLRSADQGPPDWVLTERLSYYWRTPRRWEIVLFHNADYEQVAKRVVGLPGESVGIHGTTLRLNGQPLPQPPSLQRIFYQPMGQLAGDQQVACGDGYFVLGDQSLDSWDSRYTGPIHRPQFIGRAWLIVWPPGRMRCLSVAE